MIWIQWPCYWLSVNVKILLGMIVKWVGQCHTISYCTAFAAQSWPRLNFWLIINWIRWVLQKKGSAEHLSSRVDFIKRVFPWPMHLRLVELNYLGSLASRSKSIGRNGFLFYGECSPKSKVIWLDFQLFSPKVDICLVHLTNLNTVLAQFTTHALAL